MQTLTNQQLEWLDLADAAGARNPARVIEYLYVLREYVRDASS